jgi:hypothetical protein
MAQITLNSTGVASDGSLVLQSNGTTAAVTVDTSQRVGIGAASPSQKLEVAGNIFINTSGNPNMTVKTSGAGNNPSYRLQADTTYWDIGASFSDATDPLTFGYGGSEKMRVDNAGNVGVGTTSPAAKFEVSTGASTKLRLTSTADNNTDIDFYTNSVYRGIIEFNSVGGLIYTIPSLPLTFGTNNTERARIDSSGNLLVGATSDSTGTLSTGILSKSSGGTNYIAQHTSGGGTAFRFYTSTSTLAGAINTSGNTTAYTSISDYRLKENVEPITSALEKVAALNPVSYTFKNNGQHSQGFIAHELQAVVPECVAGEKDAVDEEGNAVYQGIDTSFLVATLTAAIQEQQTLITQLTARITALETP